MFAYGSLMNAEEINRTIQSISPDRIVYAILRGYRRNWSATRDNLNHPTKRVADNVSNTPPAYVANLNISRSADTRDEVYGVCLQVSADDLQQFDLREAGYSRIEVTSLVGFPGREAVPGDRVYAYSSASGAGTAEREASYDYLNLLLDTCRTLERTHPGILSNYLNNTPLPDARLGEHALFYLSDDITRLYEVSPGNSEKKLLVHPLAGARPAALQTRFDTHKAKSEYLSAFIENCGRHGVETPGSVSSQTFRDLLIGLASAEDLPAMQAIGWKERRMIAQMPFSARNALIELSDDAAFMVRMAVAGNHATPDSVLNKMCSDRDPWVRAVAQASR